LRETFFVILKFNLVLIQVQFVTGLPDNDDYDRRSSTSPTSGARETGSGLTASRKQARGAVTTHEGDEPGVESERSSPSPVEDEATTSRLELFQISAMTDSYEADPTRDTSAEESPITARCGSTSGQYPDMAYRP